MAEKNIREMTLEECWDMTIGELVCMIESTGKCEKSKAEKIKVLEQPCDLEVETTEIIHQIGIPANIRGYRYVRAAILYVIENPLAIDAVTKRLYPVIAKEYDTTGSCVERAIRNAIKTAWECDRGNLKTYFNEAHGKPTNSEFIAMISDKLRLKRKLS